MEGVDWSVESASEWYRQHQVAPHLPSLFYLPEYVTPEQESALLREVRASKAKWVQVRTPERLAADGGDGGMYGGKPPNHVLINSYMPGEGIMHLPYCGFGESPGLKVTSDLAAAAAGGAAAATEGGCGGCGGLPPVAAHTRCCQSPGQSEHQGELHLRLQQPQPLQDQEDQEDQDADGGHTSDAAAARPEDASAAPANTPTPAPAIVLHPHEGPYGDGDCPPGGDCSRRSSYNVSLLLQPRSLVVFRDEAFTDCLHSIDEVSEELLDESVANLDMHGLSPGTRLARGDSYGARAASWVMGEVDMCVDTSSRRVLEAAALSGRGVAVGGRDEGPKESPLALLAWSGVEWRGVLD
ncbi:hypothetical protein VOLCADRAFT_92958 [Volvox carteri f. nagariensis]|uniref:Alpha-ketoglutarate-dependent dioxygenase AlkB-like domain-containing protein n=1 Tax=Volvox carteri f. nagariensis TaxID=3068 RepID=D8U0Y7_VOLCA|nr:uncharacterized protein VOLCADRAFT_92958 [Volvox carteri f. nagariensis]EFJ46464.1 hypothetical protein VOLCADRAFT_92958 [Volvox carteri f. nagariensis]|eukprot:XP_002952321.1 hypothetical protein VOLCADRAFT_92958 [Volvox carteri f. nagariensis]